MTGNKFKQSDLMVLVGITLLTVLAAIYGFSSIPSPAQQRQLKLDHKRVSDLGRLQASITQYARTNQSLPDSLDMLTDEDNTYSYSTPLNKKDPETGVQYEYFVISKNQYQLCATFTTDSQTEDPYTYDSENYNYSSYRNQFKHGIGRKCFDFTVTYYNTNYYITPTVTPYIYITPQTGSVSPTATPTQ